MGRQFPRVDILVPACIKQNPVAQKELFYAYSKILLATAFRYTRDQNSAQDIVQESFILIYKYLHQLKAHDEGRLVGWMKKITAREALRWLQKNKTRDFDDYANRQEIVDRSDKDELRDIDYAMGLLSEANRTVLQLYAVEGFSHKEIGEMLGIEESSSRARLTRARKQFEVHWSKLKNYGEVK